MRLVVPGIVSVALALVGFALVHPFGDPRIEPEKGPDTLLLGTSIPAGAKSILVSKCADCHSNETRWPVYARWAPGSWLIERDIVAARGKMNLSNWDTMSPDTQEVMVGKIVHEARTGAMPPLQYRLMHWGAQLTPADIATLSSMSTAEMGAAGEQSSGKPGDAARGEQLFKRRCTGCHAMEADREGPRLGGVFGRRAGSVAAFDYSAGLKSAGLTWNESSLERWLSDPDLIAPDTRMDFSVPKAQERSDLIAYLKHQ